VTTPSLHYAPSQSALPAEQVMHLAPVGTGNPGSNPPQLAAPAHGGHRGANVRGGHHHVRSWPLLILALPAAVAVWSGWVGIGEMTGFGQVHPLPGLWDSLHLNTAITLPIGVEAYAAYALRAWLTASTTVSAHTRRFARRSAIGSLLLGMAGQVAYHLLAQAHTAHAPWAITTAVSCLPVLVLGMGAALAHLLHADTHGLGPEFRTAVPGPDQMKDQSKRYSSGKEHTSAMIRPGLLAQGEAAATRIRAAERRISRRNLRAAGIRASNAELGKLALTLTSQPPR
jgi:hypothetical protein